MAQGIIASLCTIEKRCRFVLLLILIRKLLLVFFIVKTKADRLGNDCLVKADFFALLLLAVTLAACETRKVVVGST